MAKHTPAKPSAAEDHTPKPPANPQADIPREVMERVFRIGDTLSLAALPNTDNVGADALLALLYGYLILDSQQTVTGTSLMKSAKISGIPLDRIDRTMKSNQPAFVNAGGVKKSRRYSLNNRGIARAKEIVLSMVQ